MSTMIEFTEAGESPDVGKFAVGDKRELTEITRRFVARGIAKLLPDPAEAGRRATRKTPEVDHGNE